MSVLTLGTVALALTAPQWLSVEGGEGPGKGKHIVLLAGDEEYRSEEALPQLAKILSIRHGFRCTVLFSIGEDGTIDPNMQRNQPGLEALESADLCIMMLRFRQWPDDQMVHFVRYFLAGKPIIALRTSTHAFAYDSGSSSPYARYGWQSKDWPGGFGRQVLGETWVSHWGDHGTQVTRGEIEPGKGRHPVLRGVESVFGNTDVYEAAPPADAEVLVRGRVLSGMEPTSPPANGRKKTAKGIEQELNEPMMPVVWTRSFRNEAGTVNRVLTTTMGSATDLLDEGFRRLLVNCAYWTLGLEKAIPDRADVRLVRPYAPSMFGFNTFRRGVKPSDLQVGAQ